MENSESIGDSKHNIYKNFLKEVLNDQEIGNESVTNVRNSAISSNETISYNDLEWKLPMAEAIDDESPLDESLQSKLLKDSYQNSSEETLVASPKNFHESPRTSEHFVKESESSVDTWIIGNSRNSPIAMDGMNVPSFYSRRIKQYANIFKRCKEYSNDVRSKLNSPSIVYSQGKISFDSLSQQNSEKKPRSVSFGRKLCYRKHDHKKRSSAEGVNHVQRFSLHDLLKTDDPDDEVSDSKDHPRDSKVKMKNGKYLEHRLGFYLNQDAILQALFGDAGREFAKTFAYTETQNGRLSRKDQYVKDKSFYVEFSECDIKNNLYGPIKQMKVHHGPVKLGPPVDPGLIGAYANVNLDKGKDKNLKKRDPFDDFCYMYKSSSRIPSPSMKLNKIPMSTLKRPSNFPEYHKQGMEAKLSSSGINSTSTKGTSSVKEQLHIPDGHKNYEAIEPCASNSDSKKQSYDLKEATKIDCTMKNSEESSKSKLGGESIQDHPDLYIELPTGPNTLNTAPSSTCDPLLGSKEGKEEFTSRCLAKSIADREASDAKITRKEPTEPNDFLANSSVDDTFSGTKTNPLNNGLNTKIKTSWSNLQSPAASAYVAKKSVHSVKSKNEKQCVTNNESYRPVQALLATQGTIEHFSNQSKQVDGGESLVNSDECILKEVKGLEQLNKQGPFYNKGTSKTPVPGKEREEAYDKALPRMGTVPDSEKLPNEKTTASQQTSYYEKRIRSFFEFFENSSVEYGFKGARYMFLKEK